MVNKQHAAQGKCAEKADVRSEFRQEIMKLIWLAIPLVISFSAGYSCRILTTIFAGQYLTIDEFDAVALGQTMTNISGYSMIIAFVSPMDSLCTQANGANNWTLYSLTVHRALICSSLFLIPIVILWVFMYQLLILCGQDPIIAYNVYKWTMIYIIILPAYVCLSVARRFLSSQGIAKPLLYLAVIVYCIWHPLWLLFIFVYLAKREFIWAPICNVVTIYLYVLSIIGYCMIFKPHNPLSFQSIPLSKIIKWQTNWKEDTFRNKNINNTNINIHVIDKGMREYVVLLIAGIFSLCAEWWSWEVITILCGLLGPTQLAVHVIFATLMPLYYMITLGVGLAGAAIIGKLIGENRFYLAKYIGVAILCFTLIECCILAAVSFFIREYIPYLFSNDEDVIVIAIQLSPLFCLFILWDGFQGSFQGILRGIKKQGKSVIGVVIGPWLITIPLACVLAFNPSINLKIFGMWIGNNVGYFVMNVVFLYLFLRFDWDQNDEIAAKDEHKKEMIVERIDEENLQIPISINISHFSAFINLQSFSK